MSPRSAKHKTASNSGDTGDLLCRLLRHRRVVVLGAVATVTAAGWACLFLGTGIEMDMGGGQMSTAWRPP
jgi:hypothetical protein